jgi:Spy/CpxP family protein refolding chaperone
MSIGKIFRLTKPNASFQTNSAAAASKCFGIHLTFLSPSFKTLLKTKEQAKQMSFKRNLIGLLGVILTVGSIAVAQEGTKTPTTPDESVHRRKLERTERHRERMGRRHERIGEHGLHRIISGLELSDAQREQIRAIQQRRLEGTKAQREELLKLRDKRIAGALSAEDEARVKALREQIHTAMSGIREEVEGVLTVEQKAQLEKIKQERRARHEERKLQREQRLKERQERLKNNPQ